MERTRTARLIAQHGAMVYRRACALLRDPEEARDVTQEVLWKLTAAGDGLRDEASSWLYRVTTNACLNRLRARRRQRASLAYSALHADAAAVAEGEASCFVRELLAGADTRSVRAAVYVHVADMTYDEAAAALGVSRRTVGYLLERWRVWAQQHVADEALTRVR
jgi:RNA polymerase sigma-70 factor, ECF subfamily